jgi:hypothetical protein
LKCVRSNLKQHFYLNFTDKQGISGPITKVITVTAKSGLRKQMILHFKVLVSTSIILSLRMHGAKFEPAFLT